MSRYDSFMSGTCVVIVTLRAAKSANAFSTVASCESSSSADNTPFLQVLPWSCQSD